MIQKFYIVIGNTGANFPISQFCKINSAYLKTHGFHYIQIQDLFSHLETLHFNPYLYNTSWIIGDETNKEKNLNLPPFSVIMEKLQAISADNSIKNIIITLNENYLSKILPELIYLKTIFNTAEFKFKYICLDIIRERNSAASIEFVHFSQTINIPPRFQFIFSPSIIRRTCPSKKNVCAQIEKIFKITLTPEIYSNETICFQEWIKFINIQQTNFVPLAVFSPEVISFLYAVFEMHNTDDPIGLDEETDFLSYKSKPEKLFSYHTIQQENDIKKIFPKEIATSADNHTIDCSKIPLRITPKDALQLAKLLSTKARNNLLKLFNFNCINKMSFTSRTVFLALLAAENKIQEQEIFPYLHRSKGRIFTSNNETYTENPILTICTFTYNHAKYIRKCIDSILEQKISMPFRHIIADDCSTDGTQEILLEYAKKYPHIELILNYKKPSIRNYISVMNNLTTKYFALCDGDDFYTDENKLALQIELLEKNNDTSVCFHSTYIYYEHDNTIRSIYPTTLPNFKTKKTFYISNIILQNLIQSSSAMYKSKIINGLYPSYPSSTPPYDWATAIIYAYQNKIGYIDKPMSLYRRHGNARYYITETNVSKHIIQNCFNELLFCSVLDSYTEQKYHKLFMEKVFRILSTFYFSDEIKNMEEQKYQNIKKQVEKCFPEYIMEFNKLVQSVKNR